MKRFLTPLLLSLLLCGCSAQNPQPAIPPLSPAPPAAHQAEAEPAQTAMTLFSSDPACRQFTLPEDVTGFLLLNDNVLLFSGEKNDTTLTLTSPETGEAMASHQVPFVLTAQNAAVQILDNGLSYFDSVAGETVLLDPMLREIRRIAAPENMTGIPLLSDDGRTLYYCTASSLRALDPDSGISRVLKEMAYPVQGISALLEDSILQLSITEPDGTRRTLFLSGQTGQLLAEKEGNIIPETEGDVYFLRLQDGNLQTLLFGSRSGSTMVLEPRQQPDTCFPLGTQLLTAARQEDLICLDLYNLNTSLRTGALSVPSGLYLESAGQDAAGNIWILFFPDDQSPLLYQWSPESIADNTVYSTPYYTRQNPDYDGLAACSLYAEELSAKYGIDILVYKDAAALEPWDYHLEYEHQSAVLYRELNALDARLSRFPEGFLQTLRSTFTALKICIVRSVEGSSEAGTPETVNGVQFMDGFDAYIVLATDHNTEYALYHELCHLAETVVLTKSVAYDRWSNLNPSDFRYDGDYTQNKSRDGSPWLKDGFQYFIDTYSMSYPKEDRARLFEYAMTSGHEDLFSSPNLQAKLRQLCIGIREGFSLEKAEETLPWEHYLQESVTP